MASTQLELRTDLLMAPWAAARCAADPLDRYQQTCLGLQLWSDLLDLCLSSDALIDGQLLSMASIKASQSAAMRAAEAAAAALMEDTSEAVKVSDLAEPRPLSLRLAANLFPPALLDKLVHLPMPECLGYDLADLDRIPEDALAWLAQRPDDSPVLLLGVRTGGLYLAPLWHAALKRACARPMTWHTVRPQAEGVACLGLGPCLDWLRRHPQAHVVMLDDQPDTGRTLTRVAKALQAPLGSLWSASPGKIWRAPPPASPPVHRRSALNPRRAGRLWECLLPSAHPRFLERLQAHGGLGPLPPQLSLAVRCSQAEQHYGHGQAWLPWDHPALDSVERRLINPRKTGLTLTLPGGQAWAHLRFIGEGLFGKSEFQRAQQLAPDPQSCFLDGYRVSRHHEGLQALRDVLREASGPRKALLLQDCARQFKAQAEPAPVTLSRLPPPGGLVHEAADALQAQLQKQFGPTLVLAPALRQALSRMHRPLPGPLQLYRSALPYAGAHWHWQCDRAGRVRRFQLEANWGGPSWMALELASFALSQQLSAADAQQLAQLCGLDFDHLRASLPQALHRLLRSLLRGVRRGSPAGTLAMQQELQSLDNTTQHLMEH
ncbi:hypothetical protein H5407_08030 [Mitsuaria sp. WAJ17]|uniref:phosphoribosyltransferase n=1 Tax=Mitsuaria sp. WAJ17 TaxID=2761452 RepID=UPI0015FF36D0|nr:phosphoribosyltransferase [Mitsuaria sp. WAJ17]MBB2485179.1 hypothetical protein [Mitsuaria sp. WAJ17]